MKITVTEHAADRYIERVKPWLNPDEARDEITRLMDGHEPVPALSYARTGGQETEPFDAYLELADGIALALRWADDKLYAITTLIRTGAGEEVIAERRRRKRIKKRRSRAQKARERMGRGHKPEHTDGVGWPD